MLGENARDRLLKPMPSRMLRPGLPVRPRGEERYQVRGGGSVVVRIAAGDLIGLRDIEGGQPCEIAFADETGRFDTSAPGAEADCRLQSGGSKARV